jgi:hypothetical protein
MPLKEKSGASRSCWRSGTRWPRIAGTAIRSIDGPARESEPEQLGDLVEGLAGRVVARLADPLVAARLASR